MQRPRLKRERERKKKGLPDCLLVEGESEKYFEFGEKGLSDRQNLS